MISDGLPEQRRRRLLLLTLALGTLAANAAADNASMAQVRGELAAVTAEQAVNALEGTYGVHPGERRNHTKGTCAVGSFVGNRAAAAYSRSPLFSGAVLPVVARFSVAGGNPDASDAERSPRGMALEFRLPGGGLQHMTMLDTPMFFAAVPRTFVDRILALKPEATTGKPDLEKLRAFMASHPDARGQAAFLAGHNPPASYASDAYYGIHTFRFINARGQVTPVRWRFVPQQGEKRLSDAEMKAGAPVDFLERALIAATRQAPARWDLRVTIGEPGDAQDDPTIPWPPGRRELEAGTLTIASAMDERGAECEKINYDPLVMGDGIAPTDDPVLLFRSPSYAWSFARRSGGQ
jgi:catalase